MKVIELEQLPQHDFDQGLRDQTDVTGEQFCSTYNEVITGEPLDDEHMSRFEKTLVGALNERAGAVALLHELAFADIDPYNARLILEKSVVPSDEILDKAAAVRASIDELIEDYLPQLAELDVTGDGDNTRKRLARYVIASILFDDREEENGD